MGLVLCFFIVPLILAVSSISLTFAKTRIFYTQESQGYGEFYSTALFSTLSSH